MRALKTIIDNNAALTQLMEDARTMDAVALDTEFLWERTFFPRLGLIQLGLSDEACFLIDPLAITDLSPLGDLLADSRVVKIFHDASQDMSILSQATGVTPRNIFDTRLAAGFAGFPATLSLSNLVEVLLNIHLDKTETRTNWLKRPLTEKQVSYAQDDVRYLRAVRVLLLSRIVEPAVKKWLAEEIELLDHPENYNTFLRTDRSKKIKAGQHLLPKAREVLRRLAQWREETAETRDRPRGHILQDNILCDICNTLPTSRSELQERTAISDKACQHYGDELIALLAKWRAEGEPSLAGEKRPKKMNRQEEKMLVELHNYIDTTGETLGVASGLLGNNGEIKTLTRFLCSKKDSKNTALRQQQGWRREFLTDFFRSVQ
ncbi:MAG: ribonuclease D [Desulforhopalus sp.]|nr:ribonuclease D [Desulforhopalus sp.]